ncbi:MAG: hypothetical protein HY927_08895 [Elusimicrobia bacterium]|nr:hypothetical protein [Elusimicrobiota bacterium]
MEMGIAAVVMMIVMCGGMLLFGHKAHKGHEKEGGKAVSQGAVIQKSTETAAGLPVEAHEGHGHHETR